MNNFFHKTKYFILNTLLFLFPLFFLTFTQEFFVTNKFYLLVFSVLILILGFSFQLLFSKKITWSPRSLDVPIILIISSVALSVIFSSTNKVQALLNPNLGLVVFLSLGVLYFVLSREHEASRFEKTFLNSSLVLSFVALVFFFQPFKNINLPIAWQFLKNPGLTLLGGQLDLVIFLGFALIFTLFLKKSTLKYILLGANSLALFLTLISLLRTPLALPPLSLSWFAVLEIMKNAKTAIVGSGIDSYSQVFTRVKDLTYNQSILWSVPSYNVGRTSFLHILTEVGLMGLLSLLFLFFTTVKQQISNHNRLPLILVIYVFVCLLVVPPSLPLFFLMFIAFGLAAAEDKQPKHETDLSELPFIYFGVVILLMAFVAGGGYLLGRSYAAEYYFKKAANGLMKNNAKEVYDNMKKARVLNPNEERFVLNFSQTNLLVADALARKDADQITESDRQTIAQAVQAAISEAKELIRLNPNRASSFENLANVYKNIIPLAAGADVWTISSYQRAIVLDPANPSYRLNLGGVYYLLGRYGEAARLFEQAASLKTDWPNAYYNLAWAYFQGQKYDLAATAMQNVVNLIDKKTSPQDWEKANKDLTDFKNKLVSSQNEATAEGQLNLPQQTINELDPKLKLPPEASPEAK